jgi:hypothetical protein
VQVMLHLLRNGWLEDKQLEVLSDEIKEVYKCTFFTTEEICFVRLVSSHCMPSFC